MGKYMLLSEVIKAAKFKIDEGSEYLWNCYGVNARLLDFSKDKNAIDEGSVSCVFDDKTQQVYEVTIFTRDNKSYRWIDPDYVDALKNECNKRDIPFEFWGDDNENKWVNLDHTKDVFRKVEQVIETGNCDDDVTIDIDIDDESMLKLCLMAHERNITLNELMTEILQDAIDRAKIIVENNQNK
jgi:hypothetical protein